MTGFIIAMAFICLVTAAIFTALVILDRNL